MDSPSRSTLTSRPYNDDSDLQAMQHLLMAGRSRTDDWRYWHVGDLIPNFFLLASRLPLADHIRLWHDAAGTLVAYAMLTEDPSFDVQVLPHFEWSGLEAAALAWAETRLANLRSRDPQRWGDPLACNARPHDTRRIAFLEAHGFRRGQHVEVSLLRPLDSPLPDPALPAGCAVRAVSGAADVPDRAAIEREVWHPWLPSKITDDDYARLMRLPGYDRELDIVACTPDGTIAAYVNNWLDPVNQVGVCGPVGTRAAYRRQGFARAALLESFRRLQARGMNRVVISTGESNTPARRLYESLGLTAASAYHDYAKP